MEQPIELFFWSTPNGRKISIMLEELGVPYTVTYINIGKDEQWSPDFEAVSPNHQIPAIRDPDGPGGAPIGVFESGAILLYLGRKFGRFYPVGNARAQCEVEQWLFWQMASVGPMLGQAHHFNIMAPEENPYGMTRYQGIAKRLYTTLDKRLSDRDYLAGDYSIADIAFFGWIARHEWQGIGLADYPNVAAWLERVGARPAVQRGMALAKPGQPPAKVNLERLQRMLNAASA